MTLESSESLLDLLLEAVWLIDESSLTILYANAAAAALAGRSRAQMQGMSVLSLMATPQDHVFWGEPAHVVASGIHSFTSLLRSDGSLVPVERRVTRVHAAPWGTAYLLTMLDRQAQEASERELEALLSELRATLDSAADGMLVCGIQGSLRAFNQRLAQLWNIPEGLLLQRNDEAVYAHMAAQVIDRSGYEDRLHEIHEQPWAETSDTLLLHGGVMLERRSVPRLMRGVPVGRVYSFRDITRQTEIQASLKLAARVFEASLDAIFIADSQHRLLHMNPACVRLLGPAAQDYQGGKAMALFGAEGRVMESVLEAWERDGYWEGQLSLLREGAEPCAVQLSWVAVCDDAGRWVQSVGFMRDLTEQQAAQKRIEQLAYSDVLTGLPNRLLLAQRVSEAIDNAGHGVPNFAILFLDLDRFKIVNDSLGHAFGDRVLQVVAERLQACLRQTDMLCRLGGDEFVIYLAGAGADVAEGVARRILEDMLRPFALDGMGFSIQCSMGVALYPQDGRSLDELVKQADTAMYRVKERGRGSYGFYQPQMNAHLLSRMQLDHAMRQALGQAHMAVHFQPQVEMASGKVKAAEALVRWTDPTMGAVSPGSFIPLAEESGYIVTLGAWVMEQSVREAARWLQEGMPIVMSVNVSALEFRQPDFVERVTRLLAVYQLPPTLLELELTESILLLDVHEMGQRLRALAQLGVGLVVDDFGTGYSSLAYLKKLPITKIKIDQSFVRGLPDDDGDRAIVGAIVSMGRALNIQVLAEGVETLSQRAVLAQMDCDHFQGFLCAPGLPAHEFRELLRHSMNGGAVVPSSSCPPGHV